jgi:hypothetical protein
MVLTTICCPILFINLEEEEAACRGKKITFLTLIAALGNPSLSLSILLFFFYCSYFAHSYWLYLKLKND